MALKDEILKCSVCENEFNKSCIEGNLCPITTCYGNLFTLRTKKETNN